MNNLVSKIYMIPVLLLAPFVQPTHLPSGDLFQKVV
jgi:hypothetical protein